VGKKGDDDKKILTLIYKEIDREGSTQSGQSQVKLFPKTLIRIPDP
jgi:hypothetical protein